MHGITWQPSVGAKRPLCVGGRVTHCRLGKGGHKPPPFTGFKHGGRSPLVVTMDEGVGVANGRAVNRKPRNACGRLAIGAVDCFDQRHVLVRVVLVTRTFMLCEWSW